MLELDFSSPDFFTVASEAIERGEAVLIRVKADGAPAVSAAVSVYKQYFSDKARGARSIFQLLRFGWYGIRTPALWGVLNKADLIGARVTTHMDGSELILQIVEDE